MNKFEVIESTKEKEGKKNNGDHSKWEYIQEEDLLIIACADGVTNSGFDYLASKISCEESIKEFINSHGSIEDRLHNGVLYANKMVSEYSEQTKGMLSTLLLLVWETDMNNIYYINIGDSRIYQISKNKCKPITEDDSLLEPILLNGKHVVQGGVPLFRKVITKAMGQSEILNYVIKKTPFNQGEILVFSTDGVHNDSPLSSKLIQLLWDEDKLQTEIDEFTRNCASSNEDDATAVVLRRRDYSEELLNRYYDEKHFFPWDGIPIYLAKIFLLNRINNAIIQNDSLQLVQALNFVIQNHLKIKRESILPLFELTNSRNLLDNKLNTLLRKLMS
ncbi:MAG: SpoIIE family protein phosphatase [Ignavibacteriaceae bacterium]|nr:SpoIIE family protein phosphatase [Ignavibacteriaceae bacterium]